MTQNGSYIGLTIDEPTITPYIQFAIHKAKTKGSKTLTIKPKTAKTNINEKGRIITIEIVG